MRERALLPPVGTLACLWVTTSIACSGGDGAEVMASTDDVSSGDTEQTGESDAPMGADTSTSDPSAGGDTSTSDPSTGDDTSDGSTGGEELAPPRIWFQSTRFNDTRFEMFVMNADGTGAERILDGDGYTGVWSPDGTRLLFERATDYDGSEWIEHLFVVEMTPQIGTRALQVTTGATSETVGSWSPSGDRIAYLADGPTGADLWVVDADGSNPTALSTHPEDEGEALWSPDGSQILYTLRLSALEWSLRSMAPDGSNDVELVQMGGFVLGPRWSPDGTRVVMAGGTPDARHIYVVSADGDGLTAVTSGDLSDSGPAWSPDGTRIAFSRGTVGDRVLMVVNADGTDLQQLTPNGETVTAIDWSRDDRIAYHASVGSGADIFVIDPDGTDLVNLTDDPDATDARPVWSP